METASQMNVVVVNQIGKLSQIESEILSQIESEYLFQIGNGVKSNRITELNLIVNDGSDFIRKSKLNRKRRFKWM